MENTLIELFERTLKNCAFYEKEGKTIKVASGMVPSLKTYYKTDLLLSAKDRFEEGKEYDVIGALSSGREVLSTCNLKKLVLG